MHIKESLDKILSERKLLTERFYGEILFARYPELKQYFKDTNLKLQAMILVIALQGAVRYTEDEDRFAVLQMYFRWLGTKHHRLGIPRYAYGKFREALLVALKEFHGEAWSEQLATEWSNALEAATNTMLEGYETAYHV